ncbi:MAG: FtsX-like permease family protein [Eubacterium sp.]|nr:FtsX-like permease family protein [Eubacterium sp.]
MRKIKNPLKKRVPRELLGEWHKYLVIALFLILMIGFISGMYVANNSMLTSAENKITDYILEDGSFELNQKASEDILMALEKGEKADVKKYYLDKGYAEADKEVKKAVDEAIPEEIEKAVKDGIEEEVRAQAAAGVEAQIAQYSDMGAKVSEADKEKMIQDIVDENLQKAIDEYYEDAYEEAYNEFIKSEDYDKALEDAKEEAYREVEKTVDEEYEKASKKYDLDNPDYRAVPVKVYENFYKDAGEDRNLDGEKDGNIRVYMDRDNVDLYSIHKGTMPANDREIAIDRMHAKNVNIKLGDTIKVGDAEFKVTAFIALVNYSTLYEKPTDSMFDAIYFDVAMVTDEGFDRINKNIHYNYAWVYENKPEDEVAEKALSENVMAALISQTVVNSEDNNELKIEGFLPNYANQAIHFATNDMGGDKAMAGILLYILVTVLAFIFAITISNTITREASVIGTLRASGYTKTELLIHYMTMPVLVTLIAAIIGNVMGYTVFKNVVIYMYYNSYSLPTYETFWTPDAFIKTTVVPLIIMFIINLFVIVRMLRFSPLKFLRHDLKTNKRKKAMRLPKWSFLARFRTRILLQNIPNYIVLILGIAFVMLMLSMAVGFPESLDVYKSNVTDMMFAKYQTILKTTEDEDENLIETTTKSAEKFAMESLEYVNNDHKESISVYGVEPDSDYISIPNSMSDEEVYISSTFSDKYGLMVGDTVKLDAKYDNESYYLNVAGIYDYSGALTVFMPIENYRKCFDEDEDYFTGFMANEEIEGIDDKYIATTITEDDILKISRQLDHSMGSYMKYFQVICIILSAVLIYLLTKIIIEKNENAISMVKILGYENKEISGLYMTSTTFVVLVACVIGMFAGFFAMNQLFKMYLMRMEGWFSFVITPLGFVKMFIFVFISYLSVMLIDYNRIKKIPMDEALKHVD